MKKQQREQPIVPQNQQNISQDQQSSVYSSQDENAYLLTDKVQAKILQTVARLKNKDPELYKIQKSIFEDEDFQDEQNNLKNKQNKNQNNKKFTYKDMLNKGINQDDEQQQDDQEEELAPVLEEKKAKNKFKQALNKQKNIIQNQQDENDLFTVKTKLKKQPKLPDTKNKAQTDPLDKIQEFTKNMQPKTKKLLKSVWKNEQKMDQTDIFLRDYILSKKWMMKNAQKTTEPQNQFQQIDQQDEVRSIQMDEYEAKYNFRYQQPDGDKIVQYPRKIDQSMRIMPQTRKQKRKKVQQRKKQQQKSFREQAQRKKQQLKENILKKINQKGFDHNMDQNMEQQNQEQDQNFQHDWFFCDDCGKAFEEQENNYQCQECQDYMLCKDCYQLIIHKHPLVKGKVPQGFGAPKSTVAQKVISKLQPCKTCRRKLPKTVKHFQFRDRSQNVQLLCQRCYDQSGLDVKKKFVQVQPKINQNYIQQILQKDPEKVKQLTNSKQIQDMVDEYLKYEFEDVIGDGIKTKFKYVNVKPESYGLSDEQILFGDDKQLNKYVSIKKLAPYREQVMKLRNNIYKKKVKSIDRTARHNKVLIQTDAGQRRIKKTRIIDKLKRRSDVMKKKRQTKLRILNISNPAKEKQVFVPVGRLASYGVTLEDKSNVNNSFNKGNTKHPNPKTNYNSNHQQPNRSR